MRRTTKRSLASPTLQTRISKKRRLNPLSKSSIIPQIATSPKKAVVRVDMVATDNARATRKVAVASTRATTKVKDGNVVAKDAQEATMTAIVKTASISQIAHTNNTEMAKSDLSTIEKGTRDKAEDEAETGKKEATVTSQRTFSTCAKNMTKLR